MTARTATKTLIARQVAMFNGLSWSAILAQNPKMLAMHLTLAENILATVERQMRSCDTEVLTYIIQSGDWK